MKVLIVGANSPLGLVSKKVLVSQGIDVVTAGRTGCELKLDLSISELPDLPENLDAVVNMAAYTGEDFPNAIAVNVLGNLRLCHKAWEKKTRLFVYISSVYAMVGDGSRRYTAYAITKRHAEELLSAFCRGHQMPLLILRPAQFYGATDNFRKNAPMLYALADKAEQGHDIFIQGNHDAKRNFIHADDLAEIISRSITKKVTGIFSCQYLQDTTMTGIASAAVDAFAGRGAVMMDGKGESIEDNVFEIDSTLYKLISYSPKVNIRKGMKGIAQNRRSRK